MRAATVRTTFLFSIVFFLHVDSWSQLTDPYRSTGAPGHILNGTTIDTVDMSSGNLRINIPLLELPGRGLNTEFVLAYNSKAWVSTEYPGGQFNGPYWLTGIDSTTMPNSGTSTGYAP